MSTATPKRPLPTVAERPEADVLIYDGQCRFCTGQVERLARWDSRRRLAFISLHDPEVAKRWPDMTHDYLMEHMVVVDANGGRHVGAAGFAYLSGRMPALYPLWPLLNIPGTAPLWQWGYRLVAKRRYLMGKTNGGGGNGCDNGACAVHFK